MKAATVALLSVISVYAYATPPIAFDLGEIPQGAPSTNVFSVKNPFDEPFEISEIEKSCGCTNIEIDERFKSVPQGAAFEIKVTTKAPELIGVEPESFKALVRILGGESSQVIELRISGTVVPRVVATQGLPRFKLTSPPAIMEMRKSFPLQFDESLRDKDFTVEVDSPHCTAGFRNKTVFGSVDVYLQLLDTVRTWRPRELKALIRAENEIVAQFTVFIDYKSDIRILAAPKQLFDPNRSPKTTYSIYIGEILRSLDEDQFGVYVILEDERLAVPFSFQQTRDSGLRKMTVDYSEIAPRLKSGGKARLLFETKNQESQDSIELWFE